MARRKSTSQPSNKRPLAARGTVHRLSICCPPLLLAALLALTLTLAFAPRAEAFVYWANESRTIGRANLDGTGVDRSFIPAGGFPGVAVDAAHVYWTNEFGTIGRANLDGTGVDHSFITGAGRPWGVAVDALRSFSFGEAKPNKRKGTARLTVKVPRPGDLELANTTQVKGAKRRAEAKGKAKLPVRPRGKAKQKLKAKGKAKVVAEVSYTPTGGNSTIVGNTDTKALTLIRRR
jgi:hypothetical protein